MGLVVASIPGGPAAQITGNKRPMVKKIGTHSGSFHCDEALGCWLLRRTTLFQEAEIVRTRDPEVLKDLDVVIDVGGVYDPDRMRFDHHQRGFETKFGFGFEATKLSSAGLVYKHFGREIIAGLLSWPIDHPDLEMVYLEVYRNFIESVDAIDNGVMQYNLPPGTVPRYLNNTTLSCRVGKLNPRWNEPSDDATLYERFLRAVELTGSEFSEAVDWVARGWLPGRRPVEAALAERHSVHPSGKILLLKEFCPWKDHLYNLEEEGGFVGELLYAIFQDERDKTYRVQAVSVGPGSFENRRSLPCAWRGLRDEALSALSGIPDCVFVHAGGFIGGNKTLEGALEMAKRSLELE
ncbi:hypothetical protein VOLCADRAFT_83324 [Volvox carteri f. nagariensis]|uniref:Metal-dependent protein hydrolase n=1 Tax=Volvox carteri f. nagariensis TaxID=3068 RepID=D8UAF4_VOLCA|nr:uncharacterized protein VOLCADRAFT_83324 [Volvox carteri f. nagariensis]EFJ43254.1 hypothetical protein VOLCADRAFT_83324 [Volvox carteri f. nagariensis]|eukprot:XP_002955614.1 hypothetical protein VOLCADRAFT_83324 [Volvox carteri f. nagariensis]